MKSVESWHTSPTRRLRFNADIPKRDSSRLYPCTFEKTATNRSLCRSMPLPLPIDQAAPGRRPGARQSLALPGKQGSRLCQISGQRTQRPRLAIYSRPNTTDNFDDGRAVGSAGLRSLQRTARRSNPAGATRASIDLRTGPATPVGRGKKRPPRPRPRGTAYRWRCSAARIEAEADSARAKRFAAGEGGESQRVAGEARLEAARRIAVTGRRPVQSWPSHASRPGAARA